jgi:hypothetical protein
MWITLTCTAAYSYIIGGSGVAAPSNKGYIAAGSPSSFRVNKATLSHLRVIMPAGGDYLWWISGP